MNSREAIFKASMDVTPAIFGIRSKIKSGDVFVWTANQDDGNGSEREISKGDSGLMERVTILQAGETRSAQGRGS